MSVGGVLVVVLVSVHTTCYTTFPRTAPTRFLHQEHHTTMEHLTQGTNTPTTRGTGHTPIMALDIRDISRGHNPTLIPIVTEAAVLEGTPHTLLQATTAAHAAPQPMDAPITPHAMIPTGIVTLHPTLTTSPVGTTHATPWTGASFSPATFTSHHKDLTPERSNNTQDLNPTA